jgi:putative phosphoesterase
MNKLIQLESTLIGSPQDAEALENADSARLLVLSDSHGDVELIESIVTEFGHSCDALVFCGDGADDITALFSAPRMVDALPPVIALARGNGDGDWYTSRIQGGDDYKPVTFHISVEKHVVFKAAGRTVFAAHGHHYSVDYGPEMISQAAAIMDADMIFYGHTHRLFMDASGAALIVNPGSCSRPRGNLPPTFAVVSFPGAAERFDVQFYEIRRTLFGSPQFEPFSR